VGLATKRQVCAVAAALLTLLLVSAASVSAAVPVARAAGVVATGSDWTTDRYNNDRPTYRYRRLGVPRWRVVLRLVAKVPGPLRRGLGRTVGGALSPSGRRWRGLTGLPPRRRCFRPTIWA